MIERFVDLPEEFEVAPKFVFERLREVDPQAEIIGIGPGYWWVGAVKPDSARCMMGRNMLKRMSKDGWDKNDPAQWPHIRNAILCAQGFGIVGKYRFTQGEETWDPVIAEFAKADKLWREFEGSDPETQEAFNGVVESDRRARTAARMSEALKYDKRYMFKKLRAGVSVAVGADING